MKHVGIRGSHIHNWRSALSTGHPIPAMLMGAVSLLLDLEAARRGRSVLFSDDQKLLFEGGKKGFVKNTKLDFMRR